MNKIIISHYNEKLFTAEYDGNRIIDLNFESMKNIHLYDIYTGRVESISKNINAVFIEIADGVKCFYQTKPGDNIKVGDELLVQITKEAIKTKDPECDIQISLPGKYSVVTEGRYSLGISSKIPDSDRKFAICQLFDSTFSYDDNYSFIVRTNAYEASDDEIMNEANSHIAEIKEIREKAAHQLPFKKVYSGSAFFNDKLRDLRNPAEVITDDEDIFNEITKSFPDNEYRLYTDEPPLYKLYKLESTISDATSRKVWLKNGGYLVIDENEAMTVIDVNTGKNDSSSNMENTFYKTNMLAVAEVCAQLRLRNLSGIIIVDFIDMKKKEHIDEIVSMLKAELKKDPVKASFVDVTKLNLVEITRKKMHRPLKEQL